MSSQLIRENQKLQKKLLSLSLDVEKSLALVMESLFSKDYQKAKKVIAFDAEIDNNEIEIEEECLKILALYQPVAKDLRLIIFSLKVNNDLERIGDLAVNIAYRVKYILKSEQSCEYNNIRILFEKSLIMYRDSIRSFIELDVELAQQVCQMDDEVDNYYSEMFTLVQDIIKKDPEKTEVAIHTLSIARNLERVADYATNISEGVRYLVNGEIVRHGNRGS